jgi:hypothetical protein
MRILSSALITPPCPAPPGEHCTRAAFGVRRLAAAFNRARATPKRNCQGGRCHSRASGNPVLDPRLRWGDGIGAEGFRDGGLGPRLALRRSVAPRGEAATKRNCQGGRCHSRGGGNPRRREHAADPRLASFPRKRESTLRRRTFDWIPACAGMTVSLTRGGAGLPAHCKAGASSRTPKLRPFLGVLPVFR